jgi:hypothetical protein
MYIRARAVSRQIRQWRKKIQSGEKKSEVAKNFFLQQMIRKIFKDVCFFVIKSDSKSQSAPHVLA